MFDVLRALGLAALAGDTPEPQTAGANPGE